MVCRVKTLRKRRVLDFQGRSSLLGEGTPVNLFWRSTVRRECHSGFRSFNSQDGLVRGALTTAQILIYAARAKKRTWRFFRIRKVRQTPRITLREHDVTLVAVNRFGVIRLETFAAVGI